MRPPVRGLKPTATMRCRYATILVNEHKTLFYVISTTLTK